MAIGFQDRASVRRDGGGVCVVEIDLSEGVAINGFVTLKGPVESGGILRR